MSLTLICCLPSGSLSLNLFMSYRSCQPISSFDYFRFIYIALSNDKPHILLSHQWYLTQPLLCWEQAGGSLRKEQTIHPLARFAYFEGANSPWEQRSATLRRSSGNGPDDLNWLVHSAIWKQRRELDPLLKDNETRDLTVCPRCYIKLDAFSLCTCTTNSATRRARRQDWTRTSDPVLCKQN